MGLAWCWTLDVAKMGLMWETKWMMRMLCLVFGSVSVLVLAVVPSQDWFGYWYGHQHWGLLPILHSDLWQMVQGVPSVHWQYLVGCVP